MTNGAFDVELMARSVPLSMESISGKYTKYSKCRVLCYELLPPSRFNEDGREDDEDGELVVYTSGIADW